MRAAALAGMIAMLVGSALWPAHADAPAPAQPDRFAPIRFLAGEWTGTASGQMGGGTLSRSYAFVLRERFLHERSTTTYPPQEQNPKGELHEQLGYFSYDRARERIVFRQFHAEGFVNTYVFDPLASGPAKLVFASEDFENLDDAWRARETYERLSPDEFVETFELSPPGKPFELYSRSHLKRSAK